LSILEYCRREELSAGNFHAWKRRLQASRSTAARTSKKRVRQQASPDSSARGGFVQFPVTAAATIEIRFAGGAVVSMPAENLAALSVALKVLQAPQQEGAADD
jgi:hypothetical protein